MGTFPQDHGIVPPARHEPPSATSLVGFAAARTLDAELAALVWLMVDAHVPLVIASADPAAPAEPLLGAFVNLLGPSTLRLELNGEAETFDWIGDAAALGWPGDEPTPGPTSGFELQLARALALPPRRVAPPETTFLLAGELGAQRPATTWGARARTAIRALQRGYGMAAVVRADSLEQVLLDLAEPPASLGPDELRRLGIVLVLQRADGSPRARRRRVPDDIEASHGGHATTAHDGGTGGDAGTAGDAAASAHAGASGDADATDDGRRSIRADAGRSPRGSVLAADGMPGSDPAAWRIAACHYVRPLERDAAGHVQRRPPAILATWDPTRDVFEHFAWGVTAELAMRVGLPRDEFEREHAARTRLISALVASGRTSTEELQAALAHRSGQGRGGDA